MPNKKPSLSSFYQQTRDALTPEEKNRLERKETIEKKFTFVAGASLQKKPVLLRICKDKIWMHIGWSLPGRLREDPDLPPPRKYIVCLFLPNQCLLEVIESNEKRRTQKKEIHRVVETTRTYLDVVGDDIAGRKQHFSEYDCDTARFQFSHDSFFEDTYSAEKGGWGCVSTKPFAAAIPEVRMALQAIGDPSCKKVDKFSAESLELLGATHRDNRYETSLGVVDSGAYHEEDLENEKDSSQWELGDRKTYQGPYEYISEEKEEKKEGPTEEKIKEHILRHHAMFRSKTWLPTQTKLNDMMSLREMLLNAKDANSRTREVCSYLNFMKKDGSSYLPSAPQRVIDALAVVPASSAEEAKEKLIAQHAALLKKDGRITLSHFDKNASFEKMLERARGQKETDRTRRACYLLGWMKKDGTPAEDAPELVRGVFSKLPVR